MNRKIPATMATQHPDNASSPYWEKSGDGFVSTQEEVLECFSAYHDLHCEEYMWDWEGKYVDEAVVDKLFHTHHDYFKKHQLGKDIFLTFRIPNIWQEKGYALARAMMGMLTAENFARDLKFHTPPLFEVILPFANKAEKIIYMQKTFTRLATFKCELFGEKCHFHYINVLPLFEGVEDMISCRKLLDKYLHMHKKEYKRKPEYLRLHIARSDPALNSGLVSAVVGGKIALSEFYRFGKDNGIKIFPAIGVGSLPFRGSLSPERIKDFIHEYSGIKTVYVQSGFRYDFPLPKVKKAIRILNERLQKTHPTIFSKKEIKEAVKICEIFSEPYKKTVESLANTINSLSKQVPSRRERKLHIGLFGYSRSIGKKRLPRAIPFTAIFYSLGVPPEFIGTGRGLIELQKTGVQVEKYYKNFKKDLTFAGRFLNKENLLQLSKKGNGWKMIKQDVELLEKYFHTSFGPKESSDYIHYGITSLAYKLWKSKKPITNEITESGKIRKSLG